MGVLVNLVMARCDLTYKLSEKQLEHILQFNCGKRYEYFLGKVTD